MFQSHNELTTLISKAGKELVKREITLVDRSETEVSLTLWGNTATNFSAVGNPIVAAKGAKVSDFNGVTLSGGDILINPDMDLAHELKGWWDNEGCSAKTNSITIQGQRGGQDRVTTTKMLGEVKQENLGSGNDRGEYYSTTATITFFRYAHKIQSHGLDTNLFIFLAKTRLFTKPVEKRLMEKFVTRRLLRVVMEHTDVKSVQETRQHSNGESCCRSTWLMQLTTHGLLAFRF